MHSGNLDTNSTQRDALKFELGAAATLREGFWGLRQVLWPLFWLPVGLVRPEDSCWPRQTPPLLRKKAARGNAAVQKASHTPRSGPPSSVGFKVHWAGEG